eukprot:GHVT01014068.1.p1 GENE.GHVT01014068.1~~GHVT01014068.1.p1  ORF type:complete len:179 (+),score=3.58 GHVT01014068.1:320-856(+)
MFFSTSTTLTLGEESGNCRLSCVPCRGKILLATITPAQLHFTAYWTDNIHPPDFQDDASRKLSAVFLRVPRWFKVDCKSQCATVQNLCQVFTAHVYLPIATSGRNVGGASWCGWYARRREHVVVVGQGRSSRLTKTTRKPRHVPDGRQAEKFCQRSPRFSQQPRIGAARSETVFAKRA